MLEITSVTEQTVKPNAKAFDDYGRSSMYTIGVMSLLN